MSGSEAESSAVSSIASSLVGAGKQHGGALFGAARCETLKATLARAASEQTVLSGRVKRKDVVISPHIDRMLIAYRCASNGGILVVCSPPDSGKTHAAEYLMHGKHPCRPERSLKVSAASLKDFPVDYLKQKYGVDKAASNFGRILCDALASPEPDEGTTSEFVQVSIPFEESAEISIYGPDHISAREPTSAFERLPLLVIDNFNNDTEEHTAFATKLLQDAAETGVFVFILTTNQVWATKLVKLNGGSKIKPLYGNVDKPGYEIDSRFEGEPIWNDMPWKVATLRELIRPRCEKQGLDPVDVVPDDASMTPRRALDAVMAKLEFYLPLL